MKREIIFVSLGILFITIGAFLLVRYQSLSLPLSKSDKDSFASESIGGPSWPQWISIPNSKINAQIAAGGYKEGKWILDKDFVLYLPTSGKLGEGGNTVLYAHSRERLFGNLKKASIGDIVILGDANGKMHNYTIYSMEYIKPYQVEKIETNKKDTITLFTCNGWFDEKRLVVKAKAVI